MLLLLVPHLFPACASNLHTGHVCCKEKNWQFKYLCIHFLNFQLMLPIYIFSVASLKSKISVPKICYEACQFAKMKFLQLQCMLYML
jgi:hypothetical protein